MATDYSLNLRATLDTSEVQQKLQQLGQTGTTVNNQIDQSVKNLDKSVKQLANSFDQAAKQQAQLGRLALRMGATYIGHQLLGNIASQNAGTNIGTLASVGQGALGGAAMGAAAGPLGMAAGAAIGALAASLKELENNAKAAADEITRQADAQQKQIQTWRGAKADVEWQQQLRGVTASQAGSLRSQADAARARYESFMTGDEGKKYAEWYKSTGMDDFVNAREQYRQGLLKNAERLEALAAQAEKLAQTEKKEADIAAKKAEADEKAAQAAEQKAIADKNAVAKSAAAQLGSFAQQQRLEEFGASLGNMSVSDLQNLKESLTSQKSALAGRTTDLLEYAQTTGSAADLEAAQNAMSEFNEASRMLQMVEGALGGTSPLGGLSLQQSMQALGSEAQKGYDASGYGNIDQQMLKVEQETKDATKESASTLRSIDTKLDEVKNVIVSNGNGTTWG